MTVAMQKLCCLNFPEVVAAIVLWRLRGLNKTKRGHRPRFFFHDPLRLLRFLVERIEHPLLFLDTLVERHPNRLEFLGKPGE